MMVPLAILLSGAAIGALGTVIGFGGGFLMVPLLHLGFGFPMHGAVAASLLAIFPSALLSATVGYRRGLLDLPLAVSMETSTALTTVFGSMATAYLPERSLRLVFGVVVGAMGLDLVIRSRRTAPEAAPEDAPARPAPGWLPDPGPHLERAPEGHAPYRVSLPLAAGFGGLAGFLAGLLGIGGGFLKTPVMVHLFGVPAAIAAPTGLAMIAVTALVGAITHYRLGHLDPRLGALVTTGFVAGAVLANLLDRGISERTRRRWIALGLLAAGGVMLLSGR